MKNNTSNRLGSRSRFNTCFYCKNALNYTLIMTLCTAWVRKSGNTKELIVATDSRLRSCGGFDGCPKIFPLPRKDAIICFQGDTMLAYPLMIHIQRSIDLNFGLATRAIDFSDGRHAFLDMINKMMGYVFEQIPEEKDNPPVSFILAGYSWKKRDFFIWRFVFDRNKKKFRHHTPSTIMKNKIDVIGDDAGKIRLSIHQLLVTRGKKDGEGFNMEPFEIIRDKIRLADNPAIGGAPQMVKLYPYMNINPIIIKWENKQGEIDLTYFGRALLKYEVTPFPILDPDTLNVDYMKIQNPEYKLIPEDI